MLIDYNRSEDLINAERLAKHLCDDMCEVSDFLGIQSQFLRYAKMTARTRNIDLDIQSQDYFRAWTLRGTMHIHNILDYGLYVHDGIMSKYMTEYWDDNSVITKNKKSMYMDFFLDLVQNGFSKKEKIIELMYQNGMTEMEKSIFLIHGEDFPDILSKREKYC